MLAMIRASYKKNRISTLRAYPLTFIVQKVINAIISILIPIFFYIFVFKENLSDSFYEYSNTSDYVTYVVLGNLASIVCFSTLLNVGRSVITEIREGTFDSFVISTASRTGYFLGTFIEQMGRTLIEAGLVVFLGYLLGLFSMGKEAFISLIGVTLIVSVSSFTMAMTLAALMVFTRDTFITQNTVYFAITVICGVAYPVEFLPRIIQVASRAIPLTYSVELYREVVLAGKRVVDCGQVLFLISITSLVYLTLGFFWYKKMEHRIVESVFS